MNFRGSASSYPKRSREEDSWFFADLGCRKSGRRAFFLGLRPSPLYILWLGPLPRNLVNALLRPQTKAGMSRSRCLVTVDILETSFLASPEVISCHIRREFSRATFPFWKFLHGANCAERREDWSFLGKLKLSERNCHQRSRESDYYRHTPRERPSGRVDERENIRPIEEGSATFISIPKRLGESRPTFTVRSRDLYFAKVVRRVSFEFHVRGGSSAYMRGCTQRLSSWNCVRGDTRRSNKISHGCARLLFVDIFTMLHQTSLKKDW